MHHEFFLPCDVVESSRPWFHRHWSSRQQGVLLHVQLMNDGLQADARNRGAHEHVSAEKSEGRSIEDVSLFFKGSSLQDSKGFTLFRAELDELF